MTTIKTLKDAIPEYLKKLEQEGKTKSTRYTVKLDLGYLLQHLGNKKELQNILTVHISSFFKSDFVNKTKDKPRSIHTINQIKRITRQFLVWAKDEKYIDNLPLTKDEMKFVTNNDEKAKQKAKVKKEVEIEPKELVKAKKATNDKTAKMEAAIESKEQKPVDNKPAVENKKDEIKTESDNKTDDTKDSKPSEKNKIKKTSTIVITANNKSETTAQLTS